LRPRAASLAAAGLLAMVAGTAHGHEVLSRVERGTAVAVKAFYADGEVLAYTEYQVFSPADAKIPYQKGRTDRSGYLAFVPDVAGNWHVRIAGETGHGLELDVPVAAPGQGPAAAPASSGGLASWAFVLRPLLGVLVIAALFAALIAFYRRRGAEKGNKE
jgi:nickel transport protein